MTDVAVSIVPGVEGKIFAGTMTTQIIGSHGIDCRLYGYQEDFKRPSHPMVRIDPHVNIHM